MEKAVGIQNYRRHLEEIQELNLTSDLLASVVFEDIVAVQDINGVHEIYANLEYPAEEEEITRLLRFIKDTNDPDISKDGFTNLSNRVDYLKSETGGAANMCELLERAVNEGRMLCLITLIMKKQAKGMTTSEIADIFEEDEMMIERVLSAAARAGTNEAEKIYDHLA